MLNKIATNLGILILATFATAVIAVSIYLYTVPDPQLEWCFQAEWCQN